MKWPREHINKLICTDCREGMRDIPDGSIDLIVTDPPYGYSFLGRDWDKALVNVNTWQECLRILRPGAFTFIMCAPRQDVLSRQIINLEEAGFITGFTSLYHCYASGFPKAQNISKAIDKKECRKQLIRELGRKPTKEEFDRKWKNFRKFVGYGENTNHVERGDSNIDIQKREDTGDPFNHAGIMHTAEITAPNSEEARTLDGSYGGFQPKPAVEVILVVMKPLSEKTYKNQALKNGKGITWLDEGRIPYKGNNDFNKSARFGHSKKKSTGHIFNENPPMHAEPNQKGRYPANLLVSDDVLNDGKNSKGSHNQIFITEKISKFGCSGSQIGFNNGYNDFGSFSRYFDLDKWWKERNRRLVSQPCFICGYIEEHGNYIDADGRTYCDECLISGDYLDIPKLNIKELPESVQKTYPYLIVPKASKSEKNKGCERLEKKARASINKMMGEAGDFKTGSGKIRTVKFKNHHPTVKPIKLMSYLIILGSRPNDIILDPFVGSGTTCIVAKMLNRRYIGFDNDEGYIEIAQSRLGAVETVLF